MKKNKKNKTYITDGLDIESFNVIRRLYDNTFKRLTEIEKEESIGDSVDVVTERLKILREIAYNCIKLNDPDTKNESILTLEQISKYTKLPLEEVKKLQTEYNRHKKSGYIWMVFKTMVSYQIPNSYPILTRITKQEVLEAIEKLPKNTYYHLYEIPIEGDFEFDTLYHEKIITNK